MGNWYGVKTLYRWEAIGETSHTDEDFDVDGTLLEERVVLIRATSLDKAIEKAEREAIEYSEQNYKNYYGQTVRTRYLGCCDAYDIGEDSIEDGVEVFSSRENVRDAVADSVLIDNRLGREESGVDEPTKLNKFWNAELTQ